MAENLLSDSDVWGSPAQSAPPGLLSDDDVWGTPKPKEQRGAVAEIGRQIVGGLVTRAPAMIGGALEWWAPQGSDLEEAGRVAKEYWTEKEKAWEPDLEGRGFVSSTLIKGASQLGPSLAGMGAAMINPVLGGAAVATIFGGQQAQDTYDKGLKAGLSETEASEAAYKTGLIEGFGETVADVAGAKLLTGGGKLLSGLIGKGGMSGAIRAATDPRMAAQFARDWAANAVIQSGTEFGQGYGQAVVERDAGISTGDPLEQGAEGAQSALGMSVLLGPLAAIGGRSAAKQRAMIGDALNDPNAPLPIRMAAGEYVAKDIEPTVGKEAAQSWLQSFHEAAVQDRDAQQQPATAAPDVAPPTGPAGLLGYQAGPPLVVFPDGSTMTGAEAERRRLDAMVQPVRATPADILAAPDIDTAIAAAADSTRAAEDEFSDLIKSEQSDLAYLRRDSMAEATKAADFARAKEQQTDIQIDQANALTRAQGFDEETPTAMQLALQAATQRKKSPEPAAGPVEQPIQEIANDALQGQRQDAQTAQEAVIPITAAQPAQKPIPLQAQPEPVAAAAPNVDLYLKQNEAGQWKLSRPVPVVLRETVIAEMDRRNQEGTANVAQAAEAVQSQSALQDLPQAAPEAGALPGELTSPPAAEKSTGLENIGDMAKAMSDNLYSQALGALQAGKTRISGVKDPILARAKQAFDAGLIKTADDLRSFEENGYPAAQPITPRVTQQSDNPTNLSVIAGEISTPTAASEERAYTKGQAEVLALRMTNQGLPSEARPHPTESGKWMIAAVDEDAKVQPVIESAPSKPRKLSGNLKNDLDIIAPGLYGEVAKGGDGEANDARWGDVSLVAEKLRDEQGYMLPHDASGQELANALRELIRQHFGGGTVLNETRQAEAMAAEETKRIRQETLRLADEYSIPAKNKGIWRKNEDVLNDVEAAIKREIGLYGGKISSITKDGVASGAFTAEEAKQLAIDIASGYRGDQKRDARVTMYREIAEKLQEQINEHESAASRETGGRSGEGAGTQAEAEARPAFDLAGQSEAEARADEERIAAAEAQAREEETRAAAAERQARIDAEVASRQDVAADNFTLDAQVNDQAAQWAADKKRIDDQLAGQGDIFGAAPVQPKTIADASLGDLLRAAADKADGVTADNANTDATLSRTRDRSEVRFSTPYVGTTGAKLVGYVWPNKKEEYIDNRGEDRIRTVSDWEQAVENLETGRQIVHQFFIQNPDGTEQQVSAETAATLLGISEGTVRANAKKLLEREISREKAKIAAIASADKVDAITAADSPAAAVDGGVVFGYALNAPMVQRMQAKGNGWQGIDDRIERESASRETYRFMERDGKYIWTPDIVGKDSELSRRGWKTVEIRAMEIWPEQAATKEPAQGAEKVGKFANNGDGLNDAERELRDASHADEQPGDVLLGNRKYVAFDLAVRLAREGIESGAFKAAPAQLNFRLDMAMRDVDRVLAAATEKVGAGETASKPYDATRAQELKNSIAEGEMIAKSGKTTAGRKMPADEIDLVKRSIESDKAKLAALGKPDTGIAFNSIESPQKAAITRALAQESEQPTETQRGAGWLKIKLRQAQHKGELSAKAVEMVEWLVKQNPALVKYLAVAVENPKELMEGFNQPAYHGSPYRFSKFTLDHIGMGEGAQAYGWGLYFAGQKDIAEHYRNTLSRGFSLERDGKKFDPAYGPTSDANEIALSMAAGRLKDALRYDRNATAKTIADAAMSAADSAERDSRKYNDPPASKREAMISEHLRTLANEALDGKLKAVRGQLYEVEIPEDGEYLLWDKPLSEQPENVRAALEQVKGTAAWEDLIEKQLGGPVMDQASGRDLYQAIVRANPTGAQDIGWTQVVQVMNDSDGSPERASKYLNSLGIAGIKYLDGTSRTKGEGSFNYVIFDENAIKVLQTFYDRPTGAAGNYNPFTQVMTLFRGNASDTTAVHEILHHLERMMPAEMQAEIRKEWLRAVTSELQKAQKAGDQKRIAYFEAVLAGDQKKATELLTGKGMEGFNAVEPAPTFNAVDTESAESLFPIVKKGNPVDGRQVRDRVPNMSSIESSFTNYTILPGIRSVPMSAFDESYIDSILNDGIDQRTQNLADEIRESDEINPLIVGVDEKGPYIVEGGHRFDALITLGAKEIPAVVVIDESSTNLDIRQDLAIGQDYQYLNPSEFWAVRMTNTMAARFEAKSIWARSLQWLKEALQHIKGALGLKSDHPLLKALDDLIARGTGEFVSKEMLGSATGYASLTSRALDLADSLAGPSVKTLGSLNNVVTQLHKARRDPKHFGPVFNLAMAFRTDLSRSAYRSWEMAKDILPAYDDIRGAVKTLIGGRKGQKEIARAATMLFEGTTYGGGNPLSGMRWTPQQLKDKYKATDKEIELYDQARAAIDSSLTEVSNSIAWKLAKPHLNNSYKAEVINNAEGAEDAILEALELAKQSADEDGRATIDGAIKSVNALYEQAYRLKAAGYTPLSRFGRYTVDVFETGPDGKIKKDAKGVPARLEFKKFDFEAEARAEEKRLKQQYADRSDVVIKRGVQGESRLFAGVDPETVALFVEQVSEIPGLDIKREVLDEWRREAVSQRSAITHNIKRKGIAGYSEDLPRVLATFLTSNARYASANFHMADMLGAINDIPDSMGDVKDDATTLYQYINANNEPGAWMRGLMFAWYLGGSPAAAAVNVTQPVLMTLPYLQQFGNASKHLLSSVRQAMQPGLIPTSLRMPLTRAMEEGIVEAQEIHHLYAEGMKPIIARLPGGEGLRARAQSAATLWGAFFGMAENFNRRISFLAAYKMAEEMGAEKLKAKGFPSPYAFARRAVEETQGIYAKENRPNWARGTGTFGAVGVAAFTFKQFSIQYVELLTRMYRAGPEGKAAAGLMLGLLILASGLQGVPGADDLDDLIDTILQSLGYRGNIKKAKRDALKKLAGERMADIVMYGLSAETPIDVQARLGLGNILPATGLFKPSEQNKAGQIAEVFGPPGGMARSVGDFIDAAQSGQRGSAFSALSPVFVRNIAKAYQMADTGEYKDTRGRKVENVDLTDAAIKGFGFQPQGIAAASRKAQMVRQDIARVKDVESDIAAVWAQGVADKKPDEVSRARSMMKDWNEKNPETPIRINYSQILRRVKEMKKERSSRMEKTAPKELRGYAREGLN